MVVDDDEDVRDALCEIIQGHGYDAVSAPNGKEALELLRTRERPCFVLLDLIMPVMDGWQFLDAVALDTELATIPISISTSAPERAPAGRPVFAKPINIAALLEYIDRYC
jgi:CheY-like chemotaxis protein